MEAVGRKPICLSRGRWMHPRGSDRVVVPRLVLEGDKPNIEDIQVLTSGFTPGPNSVSPPMKDLWDGLVRVWAFGPKRHNSKHLKRLYFSIELPYAYKEGTDLFPHVQWKPLDDKPGTVAWRVAWSLASLGEVFQAPLEFTVYGNTDGTALRHLTTEYKKISGAGVRGSAVIEGSLTRDFKDPRDTYPGFASPLAFDTHAQVNEVGKPME